MKYWLFATFMFTFHGASAGVCLEIFKLNVYRSGELVSLSTVVPGTHRPVQIFKSSSLKPADPYKVLIYFHGTNSVVDMAHPKDASYGTYYESLFIRDLTEKGYVVIAPESDSLFGLIPYTFIPTTYKAWQANIYPYADNFENLSDAKISKILFDHIEDLAQMAKAPKKIYLGGFSSGGYMASRLANIETFARRVSGLIINAASYGTCLAGKCHIPSNLPSWHPPTLLISNQGDSIVPHKTVELYKNALEAQGIPVSTYFHQEGDHEWLPSQVAAIEKWLKK